MGKFYRYFYILIAITLSLVASCDAPHSNPFDPLNPEGNYSKLEGYAKSMVPPYLPLSGVRVSIIGNSSISTITGTSGYFSFLNIDRTPCKLLFQKDGYLSDTVNVEWLGKKEYAVEGFLKKLPTAEMFSVYSIVENYVEIANYYKLAFKASINDNGSKDIDTVFVSSKELNFREKLTYNSDNKVYELFVSFRLREEIEKFIGKSITLSIKNFAGETYEVSRDFLKRIVFDEVTYDAPANNELAGRYPVFKWQKLTPGYKFTYSIQVFTQTNPATLETSKSGISSDSVSYSFTNALPTGAYFWVISCVDEYNNAGQSRSASFRVQ